VNFYPCLPGTYVPGTCTTGSPWAASIQEELAGVKNVSYKITPAFHPVNQTKPLSNLPYLFNNCTNSSCELNITVVQ
jgi:hypothetical protein